jgi:hypothetical protein
MIEISERQLANLIDRTTGLEKLLEHYAYLLDRERTMLNRALHELALARDAKDPVYFIQHWRANNTDRERATFTDTPERPT